MGSCPYLERVRDNKPFSWDFGENEIRSFYLCLIFIFIYLAVPALVASNGIIHLHCSAFFFFLVAVACEISVEVCRIFFPDQAFKAVSPLLDRR